MARAKSGGKGASQRAAPEKGLARIQQLMEEFPEIPRSLVLKTDLIREGIKPNAVTRQVGRWALPDAHDYFEYDKEDVHTPEETAAGYTLSPVVCYFPDGIAYRFMFDSRSPYEVRYQERGRYRLYRDGEPIEEVFFPPRPPWYDRTTSGGKPMPSVICQRGAGWLVVAALTYCEYGKDNLQCRYCNINASESTKKGLGMDRLTTKRDQDLYETMLAVCQEGGQLSLGVSGGVILDPSKEADNYARIVRALRQAEKESGYPTPIPILVGCQALEPEDTRKLKEADVTNVGFNLEVWDPRLFEIICPGKAKYVGRERWIQRLLAAVEVFGEGRVSASTVLGVELIHPRGFKTEDEAAESYLEGVEWLLAHGISAGGVPFRCAPGTMFAGMPSPRTEYFLRLELARYKMFVKHNRVTKRRGGPSGNGSSVHADFLYMGLRDAPVAGPVLNQ